ncbi:MAG TPA: DUF5317 family protein [Actinomycetota bacterium]|nr:DUF5317 family protein [Actinomycetota bacterium]
MGSLPLFILVVMAGVVAGWLRGGDLPSLARTPIRGRWLALACLAVQALIGAPVVRAVGMPRALGAVLLIVALVALVGVARANGQLEGVPLLALGLLLNLLVTLANLGVPVTQATLSRASVPVEQPLPHRPDAKHVLQGPASRLVVFGDRLAVRPLRTVTSFGEVAEFAGLFLLVQNAMAFGAIHTRRRRPSDEQDFQEARAVSWNVAD